MADSKLTGLTANTTPALTDLVYLVDDPGGTPLSQKITIADLLSVANLYPAANLLAQRNGVNAQTFQVHGSYTDASNYHLAEIRWSGTDLFMGTNRAGTGSNGQLQVRGHDGIIFHTGGTIAERWWITPGGVFHPNANNTYDIGLDAVRVRTLYLSTSLVGAGYIELDEMVAPAAPAANKGRFYYEDNGSGKTRAMILFPTGVAQQVAIEP